MRFLSIVTLCLLWSVPLAAVEVPAGGTVLNDGTRLLTTLGAAAGRGEPIADGGQRIVVQRPESSKPYVAQFTAACSRSISKGEPVLAVIKARTVGGGEQGVMLAKLQIDASPYTALAPTVEFPVPHEWTDIPVTFLPTLDGSSAPVAVQLQCGHQAQTLEVRSVVILKYAAGTPTAGFPRIKRSYPGREADAPWRNAALDRIETQRKTDVALQVEGEDGTPLRNAEVEVELIRHQFGFGSAVSAEHLASDSPDGRRYREIVDRYFSIVVFENDLKDFAWEPQLSEEQKKRRNEQLESSFAWLAQRHIAVRGHYLMQIPAPHHLQNVKDPRLIRERLLASVRERLAFVKDRVCEWDVVNHPIAWQGADRLNQRPGLERLDEEVYQLARTYTRVPFFVNEDQVFRPGRQQDGTFHYIRSLQDRGFAIAGLGNQSHFSDSYLPSPEHLLAVTDHFATIVPRQSITEFDIVTTGDEELASDFTRDILIAAFSHPAYASFLLWGFWEGAHWQPEAASWNRNWSVRKRGEVLEEWLGNTWRTKLTLRTDADGRLQWRGFPGWYQIRHHGHVKQARLTREQPQGTIRF